LHNALVVETYLKPVLDYSYKIGYYNVCVKLHWISIEIEATQKQEIIKLIRLSAVKGVRDVGFSFP